MSSPVSKLLWFTPDPVSSIFLFNLHHHKPGFGYWKLMLEFIFRNHMSICLRDLLNQQHRKSKQNSINGHAERERRSVKNDTCTSWGYSSLAGEAVSCFFLVEAVIPNYLCWLCVENEFASLILLRLGVGEIAQCSHDPCDPSAYMLDYMT